MLQCVRVCVFCGPAILNLCQRGTTDSNPHFLRNSKASIRAVQQRHNTNEPRNAHMHTNACVPPFSTCDTPDISSHPHPEKEPCIIILLVNCTALSHTWRKTKPKSASRLPGCSSPRVCSVRYKSRLTTGIYHRYYRYRTLR